MNVVMKELKTRARLLHKRVEIEDKLGQTRIRGLREFRDTPVGLLRIAVRRRHCLALVAQEIGFAGWHHAVAMVRGDHLQDHAELLVPQRCMGHQNQWFADYGRARQMRSRVAGYLLGYRRQFLVVDEHYVRSLGLAPRDPDWQGIGWDWVRPADGAARARLIGRLIGVD